jgi:hypothetical protein
MRLTAHLQVSSARQLLERHQDGAPDTSHRLQRQMTSFSLIRQQPHHLTTTCQLSTVGVGNIINRLRPSQFSYGSPAPAGGAHCRITANIKSERAPSYAPIHIP